MYDHWRAPDKLVPVFHGQIVRRHRETLADLQLAEIAYLGFLLEQEIPLCKKPNKC